jgi:hypothetical protein
VKRAVAVFATALLVACSRRDEPAVRADEAVPTAKSTVQSAATSAPSHVPKPTQLLLLVDPVALHRRGIAQDEVFDALKKNAVRWRTVVGPPASAPDAIAVALDEPVVIEDVAAIVVAKGVPLSAVARFERH